MGTCVDLSPCPLHLEGEVLSRGVHSRADEERGGAADGDAIVVPPLVESTQHLHEPQGIYVPDARGVRIGALLRWRASAAEDVTNAERIRPEQIGLERYDA